MKFHEWKDDDQVGAEPNGKEHEHYSGGDGCEIEAEPWWRDPGTIPPRKFLYGRHFIRKDISATIGAGGRFKTSHSLFEAIEMVTARNVTTGKALPHEPLRVVYLNAEEDQDELDRRVAAICKRYGVTEADLGARLVVKSVRDRP